MQPKSGTFETRINQSAIAKLFITFTIDKGEVKVTHKSFMLFAIDKYGHLDLDSFADDHFYAETPSQAAYMIKKFAKRYWPHDLENLEDRFNTKFFQKFLKDGISSIAYNEERKSFNADVESFEQEFKDLLKKYNFNLRGYGEGTNIYIQRDRQDNNGYFESNDALLSIDDDGYVDL